MTSRERVLTALNHQEPDRVPIQDAPWGATASRWKKEGLPEDTSPEAYFGFELAMFGADTSPRFPVREIEKTDTFILTTTPMGGKRKNFRDYSTTPEIVDWPIKTKDDWKEIKKRLKPDFTRVDWASGLANFQTASESGKFICYSGACGYDLLQTYMGSEQLLMAMADDAEWIREMIMTTTELMLVMAEFMMKNGFKFDGAFVYNDMGYKNGLLFSPDIYYKTHYQADKMMYGYFHSKGMKTLLHSCGNVKELIPVLIDVGLDCLQPLEVKAGMDIVELKQKFGDKMSFMGGIDARLMALDDQSRIEEEIKTKFEAAKKGGGYIYHSDHSIPKDVSFKNYCHIMELVKKYGRYDKPEQPEPEKKPETVMVQPAEIEEKTAEIKKKAKKKFPFSFGKKKTPEPAKQQETITAKPAAEPKPEEPKPVREKKNMFAFLKKIKTKK